MSHRDRGRGSGSSSGRAAYEERKQLDDRWEQLQQEHCGRTGLYQRLIKTTRSGSTTAASRRSGYIRDRLKTDRREVSEHIRPTVCSVSKRVPTSRLTHKVSRLSSCTDKLVSHRVGAQTTNHCHDAR